MKKISTVMALWKEGYFTDAEVIAWADTQILKAEGGFDDSLIELSLKGPTYCENLDSYVFPKTRKFSFLERFAIKLTTLDFTSDESIKQFIDWTSREAMGEDLKVPEVLFGYLLEEESCYDEGNPLNVFNSEIDALKPRCQIVFDEIVSELN
ncbi:hypothetical protein [Cellvibrio sp.]|jgi:hypothetical protein